MNRFYQYVLIFLSVLQVTTSFVPVAFTKHSNLALKYTVIGGIDEPDEPEIDPNSVGYSATPRKAQPVQKKSKVSAHGPGADLSSYNDNYDDNEVSMLNSDAYSNDVAGGIVPGFRLTSLCSDD